MFERACAGTYNHKHVGSQTSSQNIGWYEEKGVSYSVKLLEEWITMLGDKDIGFNKPNCLCVYMSTCEDRMLFLMRLKYKEVKGHFPVT